MDKKTNQSAYNSVTDSGVREEFETGSRRDTRKGKGRFDLLPPYALFRLARHYENGAAKYGDRNWEKGQDLGRYLDSAFRHTLKYLMGIGDEDHLSAAVWNLFSIIETKFRIEAGMLPEELDNVSGLYSEEAIRKLEEVFGENIDKETSKDK